MMSVAACIVEMQRVGVRRTVAAVTLIVCDQVRQDLQDPGQDLHVNPEKSCKSYPV
jgi:hypothetical protein